MTVKNRKKKTAIHLIIAHIRRIIFFCLKAEIRESQKEEKRVKLFKKIIFYNGK